MPERVLLVDDEPMVLRAYCRALQKTYQVAMVGSADQALALLASEPFDVLLTDHDMPGLNGLSLLQQVKARYPAVRRILMSGGSPQGLDEHVRSGLVEAFLPKPIATDVLVAVISGGVTGPGAC